MKRAGGTICPDVFCRAAMKLISAVSDFQQRIDLRYGFEERAAICEFSGSMPRVLAERQAFSELRRQFGEEMPDTRRKQA